LIPVEVLHLFLVHDLLSRHLLDLLEADDEVDDDEAEEVDDDEVEVVE
jgi:hypothetical protein